jgi:hypothetical protein
VMSRNTVLLVGFSEPVCVVSSDIIVYPGRYTCVYRPRLRSFSLCRFTLVYLHEPAGGGK